LPSAQSTRPTHVTGDNSLTDRTRYSFPAERCEIRIRAVEPAALRCMEHSEGRSRRPSWRRVGGEAPCRPCRPVVSSPPPSEPDVRVPPHPALHEHTEWVRCPLVQLALVVEYPLLRLIGAGQRSASVHRRAPPIQSCRVLTGPLRPVDGFPVLLGGSLLPRLLRVLRHAPTATADGAPAPNPPRRVRRAPPGRFPRSPSTGRQGRRPAVPRGHRRALPQHSTRPRPPDQQPSGRDGPERKPGPSAPTAHSRQFRGCRPVSGLQPLIRSPYAFLPCYRTRSAGGGPLLDRQGLLPPSAAPPASGCPSASPDRYGGRGRGLSPHPVIWRLVAQC
jgi:hypothetical protein